MSIRWRLLPSSLEVLSASKASIDVYVGQGDGTKTLKVEVEHGTVYLTTSVTFNKRTSDRLEKTFTHCIEIEV
jgi:hypothetical protein